MKTRIKKTGINGEGIGYLKRKPVFIDNALENELVEFKIIEDNGKFAKGELVKVLEKSNKRIKSDCIYNEKCGSCPLMIADYNHQLKVKRDQLVETLIKYCGYHGKVEPIIPSEKTLYYRNKCSLPFSEFNGQLSSALYQKGSNIFCSIDECILHDRKLEKVRKAVVEVLDSYDCKVYERKTKVGYRQLMVRGFDSFQVVLITGNQIIEEEIVEDIMKIDNVVSLYQGINTLKDPVNMMPDKLKLLAGSKTIPLKSGKFNFQLQPQAFFQLNYRQADKLYSLLASLISDKVDTIVEAYCGIGAISLYLSDKAKEIIGIDIEKSAVEDARFNAKLNNCDNLSFKAGDATEVLGQILNEKKVDVLVVDPPRKGIDDKLLNSLIEKPVEQIIYVSCNPATLAKNLKVLKNTYTIKKVIPLDMFPQTALVESIVLLSKNSNELQY